MLSFPQGFFENEVREDFLIDSTMKTVWAAGMEVLAAIAEVCAKYQLPWFADWGTLLGAVRHNGYVPWDDDLDICMLRPDYDRLLEVLQQELPEGYFVYNGVCGHEQEQFWTCVMNSDTISLEPERLQAFHGCPFIVGVDIYPLDYLPRDPKVAEAEMNLFVLIWKTAQLAKVKDRNKSQRKELKDALQALEQFCNVTFDRDGDLVTQLFMLANQVVAAYGEEDGDQVVLFTTYASHPTVILDKHWYDDTEYVPFECVEMPVPWKYHEVLTKEYGDYSIRVRDNGGHEYPYYNKQLAEMRRRLKEMEEQVEGKSGETK